MGQTLRPVRATFVAFGIFWGTWAVAAANIEHSLHLSAGRLGLLLSASIGAGGLAAAGSGGLAERWGTARFLSRTLVGWGAVLLATAGVARGTAFVITFVLSMMTAGLVDMAMNAAAAAGVAGDAGRMMRFHALFNTGALIGAAAAGGLLRAGISWRWAWAAVGVGGLALAARTRTASLPGAVDHSAVTADGGVPDGGGSQEAPPRAHAGWLRSLAAIRSQHLVVLALVFALTAMVEGGIDTWGVLYLRTHLAAGVLLGAGAYCIGQAIAVSTRGGAGGRIGRIGPRWGLVIGAAVAAGGLAIEAGAAHAAAAAIGLAIAAGGISLCWPLVMAVASNVALASSPVSSPGPGAASAQGEAITPAALVGALTAAGYVGWVAGPAVVGWVADAACLSTGLFLLAGLAAAAAVILTLIPARPSAVA
ncbi:MAG TPA: MFS transporter [Acidimicrobiales bacterium]|nr:MFS transporter [Acidimicrobiales bacterium]